MAAVVILLVLVALALAAIVAAWLSDQHARQAVAASQRIEHERVRAEEALWRASLAQARAERSGHAMGYRVRGLEALGVAARLRPTLELRNEAIAALASVDLAEARWQPLPAEVNVLAFDPSLETCALAEPTHGVSLRYVTNQQEWLRLPTGPRSIQSLRFSAQGRHLAARSAEGNLTVWSLPQGTLLLRTNLGQPFPESVDFTSDARHVVSLDAKSQVVVHELASGREVFHWQAQASLNAVRCHPTASVLAVAVGTEVQLWDWQRQEQLAVLPHPNRVLAVAWSDEARFLAAGCSQGEVYLWNVARRQATLLPGHSDLVTRLAFNHRGDLLVSTAFDGTTRFWDVATGQFLFNTHRGYAHQFSRDDLHLAVHRPKESVGIWQVFPSLGYRAFRVGESEAKNVWSVDFSPDGRLLAVTQADGVRLLDPADGHLLHLAPMTQAKSGWFTPDGSNLVASGAAGVRLWPLEHHQTNGRPALTLGSPRDWVFTNQPPLQCCTLSPDGRSLLAGVGPKAALLLDLTGQAQPVWFQDPRYPKLNDVAISPDGQWVATSTFHGSGTRVWAAKTGTTVRHLGGRSARVAFSPDNRWLVAAASDEYRFYETGSWAPGPAIPRDALGELTGYVAFAHDGRRMAIAKSHRLAQVVNPATQQELASLTAPDPQMINALRFAPGDRLLGVATPQGIVQVWDLPVLQQELAKLGLDWDAPPGPAMGASLPSAGVRPALPFAAATSLFICLAVVGLAVAMAAALLVFRRWHHLITSYQQIEAVVTQRNLELDRAQSELLLSQKMKALGTLAAGIAHDFNNLLSIIRMSNKLIERESPGRPEVREEIQAIERAVQQGKTVVHSMLGFTRDSAEAVGDFQVAEVVDDAMPMLTRQFLSGIVLTLQMAPGLPPVRGSRNRLQQILLNLIVNAAEAMQGEGNLGLQVRARSAGPATFVLRPPPAPSYVELAVSDSGPGIPPDLLPRIFEPFFTTKVAGTHRGTGLGLSMVYSIAEHDGLGISVETAPGQGATFRILLPVPPPASPTPEP